MPCSKGKRLNVLGIYNRENRFHPFGTEGRTDSQFVIGAIDQFAGGISRPTVLVVDNAPIHTSKLFKEKIEGWAEGDLYIFYLPKYSPELNLIEILWRFVKYEWLEVEAYRSWECLMENLDEIFGHIGTKYTINFK